MLVLPSIMNGIVRQNGDNSATSHRSTNPPLSSPCGSNVYIQIGTRNSRWIGPTHIHCVFSFLIKPLEEPK